MHRHKPSGIYVRSSNEGMVLDDVGSGNQQARHVRTTWQFIDLVTALVLRARLSLSQPSRDRVMTASSFILLAVALQVLGIEEQVQRERHYSLPDERSGSHAVCVPLFDTSWAQPDGRWCRSWAVIVGLFGCDEHEPESKKVLSL